MRESQQQTLRDPEATLVVGGEETTLVAPRFDDDETLVARPVVPLEKGVHAHAPAPQVASEHLGPHATRRSRMFALVLVSVLVGGVLGGAGLYLYQRQSQDPTVDPASATQPDADAAQATAAPPAENQTTPPLETQPPQIEAPVAAAPDAEESPVPDEEVPPAVPAREPESAPAAERRDPDTEDGTPKRGKKGSRDEEIERRNTPRPDDGNIARDDSREARRVDSIFYRPRRAERRAERRAARRARRDANDSPDRLRRIFEGGPQ